MKRILMAASAMTVIGGAAFAGGYTAPVVEAPVAQAPAPVVVPTAANWTGFYAGAQIGYGKPQDGLKTDGAYGGVHAGYLKDFGSYVLGGELAYNGTSMDSHDAGKVKDFTDAKFIVGVPVGNGKWLPYGALGASFIDAKFGDADHSDVAPLVALGVKYEINNHWNVGTEVAYRKLNDFDNTHNDLGLTTVGADVSYRF